MKRAILIAPSLITDLTWQQVQEAIGITGAITVVSGKVVIDVGLISGSTIDALTDAGVLKFVDKLLEAGLTAQTAANHEQAAGERLSAFNAATIGAASSSGLVPVTRSVSFRYVLGSATAIQGASN